MKKTFQKLTVLLLALTMVLSMTVTAFAADGDTVPAKRDGNSNFTTTETKPNDSEKTTFNLDDTSSITLLKKIDAGTTGATATTAEFKFTITPLDVWNANKADGTKYNASTMPKFESGSTDDKNVYTVTASSGANPLEGVVVNLPTYEHVGDYWYTVQEVTTYNPVTGMIYGTNDAQTEDNTANLGHNATYYMHVQVLYNESKQRVRSVTLHLNAPDATSGNNTSYNSWVKGTEGHEYENYESGAKVNDIENKIYTGALTITKSVTGNAGNKDQFFPVKVTFTKPEGTVIESDITYSAFTANDATVPTNCAILGQGNTAIADTTCYNWDGTNLSTVKTNQASVTVTVYVKDATEVIFSNIPYGVTYTISEQLPEDDTYEQKMEGTADAVISFAGSSIAADENKMSTATTRNTDADANGYGLLAAGTIADANDSWKIVNEKTTAIDVGVIVESAPFVAILVIAAVGAVVIFARRRNHMIEE